MGMGMGMGTDAGTTWLSVVVLVVVLGAVATLAVLVLRSRVDARMHPPELSRREWRSDEAEQLLRRRLAAGEIDEDEYLRRRSALDA